MGQALATVDGNELLGEPTCDRNLPKPPAPRRHTHIHKNQNSYHFKAPMSPRDTSYARLVKATAMDEAF